MTETAGTTYQRLRADVLGGEFGSETELSEHDLGLRYQVSRTPIREALARLEHDDLIEKGLRGYRIRSGTPTDVLEAYETRIPLEHLAASLAAKRHTELELAALRLLHARIADSHDLAEAREWHTRFHETIWQAAHNSTLESTLRRITSQLRIFDRATVIADDREQILFEHNAILTAIGNSDAERAGELARAHLERTRESRLIAFASQSSGLSAP